MTIPVAGRGPEIVGIYALFITLTTLTVWSRIYCRACLLKAFGADDWLAIAAWAFFMLHASFAITGAHHGTGQHSRDIIPAEEIPAGIKWWWLCEPVYVLSNMAIKGSIAIMLLRLITDQAQRAIIWSILIITEIYSIFFFLLFLLQCRPAAFFRTRFTDGHGSCIDPAVTVNVVYAYSAITCIGDWTYSILPVALVRGLQMNKRTKFVVAVILAMGAVASIATIIRIPYVGSLANQEDFLYATTDVAIWSCTETGLGITAACGATLRPLFREILGGSTLRSSLKSTRAYTRSRRRTRVLDKSVCASVTGWI